MTTMLEGDLHLHSVFNLGRAHEIRKIAKTQDVHSPYWLTVG